MPNYDDKAFDAMSGAIEGGETLVGDKWYTESHYNTEANKDDMIAMDRKANSYLQKMYKDDKDAGFFEKLNYDQYIQSMSSAFFTERINFPKETDPEYFEEVGEFFNKNYEGDYDQFLASARKHKPSEEE